MKRKMFSALCVLVMLCAVVIPAYAHEVPDLSRTGSISVSFLYQGQVVPGGSLTVYQVADLYEEDGDYSFRYLDAYSGVATQPKELTAALAAELAGYTAQKSIQGTAKQIDAQGKITFSDLKLGLYLVVQTSAAEGYSAVSPFLVSVPNMKEGACVYNVDASPKVELEPSPAQTTTPTEATTVPTKPNGGKVPQTGQMNWPVPILVSLGLVLFGFGWYLHRTDDKKSYEK